MCFTVKLACSGNCNIAAFLREYKGIRKLHDDEVSDVLLTAVIQKMERTMVKSLSHKKRQMTKICFRG